MSASRPRVRRVAAVPRLASSHLPPSDTHIRMDSVHKILEGKIVRLLHTLWGRYSLKDDCQDFEGQKLAERIYTLALAAIAVRSGPKI